MLVSQLKPPKSAQNEENKTTYFLSGNLARADLLKNAPVGEAQKQYGGLVACC